MVYTTYLWCFLGWFTIARPSLPSFFWPSAISNLDFLSNCLILYCPYTPPKNNKQPTKRCLGLAPPHSPHNTRKTLTQMLWGCHPPRISKTTNHNLYINQPKPTECQSNERKTKKKLPESEKTHRFTVQGLGIETGVLRLLVSFIRAIVISQLRERLRGFLGLGTLEKRDLERLSKCNGLLFVGCKFSFAASCHTLEEQASYIILLE